MQLKGSKTEKNLLTAFAGEAQARNRYSFFASHAKKENFEQISSFFIETADNEKEHAKRFFKFLEGGDVEVTASFPAGIIASTTENLEAAAIGENHEWSTLYPEFAWVADTEGFTEIAKVFRNIARAEKQHEKRYRDLLKNIKEKNFLKKMELFYGSAATAVMSMKGWTLPRNFQLVFIPKRTLNFYRKIGKI